MANESAEKAPPFRERTCAPEVGEDSTGASVVSIGRTSAVSKRGASFPLARSSDYT